MPLPVPQWLNIEPEHFENIETIVNRNVNFNHKSSIAIIKKLGQLVTCYRFYDQAFPKWVVVMDEKIKKILREKQRNDQIMLNKGGFPEPTKVVTVYDFSSQTTQPVEVIQPPMLSEAPVDPRVLDIANTMLELINTRL